jgi:anion-transporting  ArsA/GET3 family ATPase
MKNQPEVIVCVGTGGVGKTTISSAIGIASALKGNKTLVMTIDPAKRLAQAMGIKELTNTPTPVPIKAFKNCLPNSNINLDAMILETKTTFNNLIKRYSSSPQKAEAILNNSYYQYVSGELTGSEDYMAMEKLYEIKKEYDYDLIVVDTPPARHAINFLTAPNRMIQLISSGVLKWLIRPSKNIGLIGLNIINKAPQKIIKLLKSYVGLEIVEELIEFFSEFDELYSGFRTRAKEVDALLSSKKVQFYMVTAPTQEAIEEAIYFYSIMKDYKINFAGFIVNKIHKTFYDDIQRTKVNKIVETLGKDDSLRAVLEETLALDKIALHDIELIQYLKTKIKSRQIKYYFTFLIMDEELMNLCSLVKLSKSLEGII